jgi:hypothetical protein
MVHVFLLHFHFHPVDSELMTSYPSLNFPEYSKDIFYFLLLYDRKVIFLIVEKYMWLHIVHVKKFVNHVNILGIIESLLFRNNLT